MKTFISFLILCLIATCNAELRTWTAVNGKEVEAEFVSKEKGIVKLKLKSGKVFEVPANKLSKADQKFLKAKPTSASLANNNIGKIMTLEVEVKPVQEKQQEIKNEAKAEETVIWEIKGEGISIIDEGKKFVRSANNPRRYCGSRSKYPIPKDKLITIRIDSASGQMFSYIGLTSKEVDVNNFSTKRPYKRCLYFSNGSFWAGIHDSEFGKNNSTDWRAGVVPIVKSSETISLNYSSTKKKITFYKNNKEVYVGNGFEGDLYLFGAVNYPEESISILD